jgi:outer membrane protein assembly factor BamD
MVCNIINKHNSLHSIFRIGFIFILIILVFACSKGKKDTSFFEPADMLKEADLLISEEKYEEARVILEDIRVKDTSQKYAIIARLRIADTFFEDESYEEAAVEYESFLSVHTRHRYASYAQFKLAMCYFKRIKAVDVSYSWARRALDEFEKLQHNYPRNPYLDISEERIKVCKRVLAEFELYIGRFYFKKGSFDAAVLRFNNILQTYPGSTSEPDALYYIGVSYNKMGQQDKAEVALNSLIEKYPSTEITGKAKELLASILEHK